MDPKIEWLGHDGFRLTGEKVVYIDPWQITNARHDADVVLITHDHFDHFVLEDLDKVRNQDTLFVVPKMLEGKIQGQVQVVERGDAIVAKGVPVEVTAAYNLHPDRQNFHPDSVRRRWLHRDPEREAHLSHGRYRPNPRNETNQVRYHARARERDLCLHAG